MTKRIGTTLAWGQAWEVVEADQKLKKFFTGKTAKWAYTKGEGAEKENLIINVGRLQHSDYYMLVCEPNKEELARWNEGKEEALREYGVELGELKPFYINLNVGSDLYKYVNVDGVNYLNRKCKKRA
jgi:hypothetical protein